MMKFFALPLALMFLAVPASRNESADELDLPVIMYHHISEDPRRWGEYVVSPETFEEDIKYLREMGYKSVSVEDLRQWRDGKAELPEKSVLITFDDGQLSFVHYALPVLRECGMSAVTAIVGSYAEQYSENGDMNVKYAYCSWETIGEMADDPAVEIAAHSYDMHEISPRFGCSRCRGENIDHYRAALTADTEKFKKELLENAEVTTGIYAFPFGCGCRDAKEILTDMGFDVFLTCSENVNVLKKGETLELGRFNRSNNVSRYQFFARLGIK